MASVSDPCIIAQVKPLYRETALASIAKPALPEIQGAEAPGDFPRPIFRYPREKKQYAELGVRQYQQPCRRRREAVHHDRGWLREYGRILAAIRPTGFPPPPRP